MSEKTIEFLKKQCPKIPDLAEVDEITDPLIIAHYSGEYFGFCTPEPIEIDYWIIAGEDVIYKTKDDDYIHDFHCYGIAHILETEMGFFDLYMDIALKGATFDQNWKPIPLSKFNWG